MKMNIEITDYDPSQGMHFNWETGHSIRIEIANNRAVVNANEAGLISLANHLLTLAQQNIPTGYHFHLDDSNGLEEGSCEIIFEKSS